MNDERFQIDPDLTDLADRLDRLAGSDRAQPDAGFEARCLDQIRREVLEPLGEPIPIASGARWTSAWVLAAAASVVLVVTAGMLMWANRPVPVSTTTLAADDAADEIDEFIETVGWLEDSLPAFASNDDQDESLNLDTLENLYDDVEQTLGDEESM